MNRAVIDKTRQYRYLLRRELQEPATSEPCTCTFIMLNPSTADEKTDDRTITRCRAFARGWGCTTLDVVNLSPFRSSSRDDLRGHVLTQEVIETNVKYVHGAVERSCCTVAAWGDFNLRAVSGAAAVLALLADLDKPVYALRLTKNGAPWHPVRLPGNIPCPCPDGPRLDLRR